VIDLRLGDCLEILPGLADKCADAICTDLPYGTTACSWDVVIPFAPMWEQVKRLCKGAFVTTASQPFTSLLVASNLEMFRYEWVWDKVQPTGALTAKIMPMKQHENICVFSKNGHTYNRQMAERSKKDLRVNAVRNKNNQHTNYGYEHTGGMVMRYAEDYDPTKVNPKTIITFSKQPTRTKSEHPTQKPVALYEYLIQTYTNPGDTVMDFCMGSGTTGVACVKLGRSFIGIEKEPKYYNIAARRIAEAQQQMIMEL
jgi:site-specific DNA-methyltransferase (adenine-specific)